MKKLSSFKLQLSVFAAAALLGTAQLKAQAITENFDDITLLAGNGWSLQNLSTPVGSTSWFQGTNVAAGGPFDSYNGAANAYIGANYNNTGNTGTISNWLLTPNRTLRNGDVFVFYTRKVAPDSYADRLEVRLSTNGASTNAGTNATTVGDFTTLLLSINPNLVLGVYPTVWTQYTITISGLSAPTSGRLGFRYFVTGAGLSGTNSDYIGIDAFTYTPYVCPAFTVSPSTLSNGTAGVAYSASLSQTGALGTPSWSVTAGALPPGMTLSASGNLTGTPTATGTFNFTVTVGDNSGCTGTRAYSLTIACPTSGATMSTIPALCDNGSPYILTQGSPAGGTYSGTNVSGGFFDPSGGTQTITYTVVDPYGCTQVTTGTATVNTAPTVTLSSFTPICSNGGNVTLTGGSPAGGTYMGVNVGGTTFDPSGGTQNITYTYTDGNGCSNSDMQSYPVNMAPNVTLASFTAVCSNAGMITLTGGFPAGGTYTGNNVTSGMFDPTGGTQTITYMYADSNGCSNSASQSLTVNDAPIVTQSSFTPMCSNDNPVTLTGGSPAGGTYSGTNVSGGMFDPSGGTQTVTYMYTDANGCSNSDSQTFTVNQAPTVNLGQDITSCTPVTLDAGAGFATYTWCDGSTAQTTMISSNSTCGVMVTDANGCAGTDTINVTINQPIPPTLQISDNTLCFDDGNAVLTGVPTGGTFSGPGVSGNSFDPSSAGNGTHTITYTATDVNGCSASNTTTVTVSACVGINEHDAASVLSIFPNPGDGQFTLSLGDAAQVMVFDAAGKLMLNQNFNAGTHALDGGNWPAGLYLLRAVTADQSIQVRLVVTK